MIPTEPIGSLPRPLALIAAVEQGDGDDRRLEPLYDAAIWDTIERLEATGSPIITERVFVGVVAPIDPQIETPLVVRDRIREVARFIPLDQLGTTDDCGFSPFADDLSTTRETAFAKIRARVIGTELASELLGV